MQLIIVEVRRESQARRETLVVCSLVVGGCVVGTVCHQVLLQLHRQAGRQWDCSVLVITQSDLRLVSVIVRHAFPMDSVGW